MGLGTKINFAFCDLRQRNVCAAPLARPLFRFIDAQKPLDGRNKKALLMRRNIGPNNPRQNAIMIICQGIIIKKKEGGKG